MERFDVIVVGAGLAGLSCAYCLAKAGLAVLVVERGDYPGAKNVSGGRIYAHSLRRLLPGLWDDAPFERHVVREVLTFMNEEASVSVELSSGAFNQAPYHSYTVLRARFDQWLAAKVENLGGVIVTKMKVDEALRTMGRVVGIKAGEDEVAADVVVAADGVNSFVARSLGLASDPEPKGYAIGVKEVIQLPRKVIEERFNLEGEEGVAMLAVGYPSRSLHGGGFLYTNLESVSLGVVVGVEEAMNSNVNVSELTAGFKAHASIRNLVRDGRLVEYSAHLIPEHGQPRPSSLVADGLVMIGDAAGLCLNLGYSVRGMDYAVASGVFAAEAIIGAKQRNDYSQKSLSHYTSLLRQSFVMRDFQTFRRTGGFLRNQRLYNRYPDLLCDVMERVMYFDDTPKERLAKVLMAEVAKNVSALKLVTDVLGAYRSL